MLSNLALKAIQKLRKVNKGKWKTLSTGEKIAKVVLRLVELALFLMFGLIVLVIIGGFWIAFGLMGGINDAVYGQIERSNRKYRGDDTYYY